MSVSTQTIEGMFDFNGLKTAIAEAVKEATKKHDYAQNCLQFFELINGPEQEKRIAESSEFLTTVMLSKLKENVEEAISKRIGIIQQSEADYWKYLKLKSLFEELKSVDDTIKRIEGKIEETTAELHGIWELYNPNPSLDVAGISQGKAKMEEINDATAVLERNKNKKKRIEEDIKKVKDLSLDDIKKYFFALTKASFSSGLEKDNIFSFISLKDISLKDSSISLKEASEENYAFLSELASSFLELRKKADELKELQVIIPDRELDNQMVELPDGTRINLSYTYNMDRTSDGEIKANQENEKIAREENERLSAIPREFIDSEENFRDVISYLFERQKRFSFGRKQYEDACIFYELPFSPIKDLPEYKSFKEKLNAWKEDLPCVERMKARLQESQLHEMKKTFDNIYRDWVEKTMSVAIPKIYVTNWLFDLSHRHGKELDIESMRSPIREVIFKNDKLYGQIKEKNENALSKKQEEVEPIKNRIYDLLGIDEQERANFPIPYRCFEITPEEQANINRLPEDKKDDVGKSFIMQELIRRIGKARAERTLNDIIKSYSEKSIQRNKLTGEQESEFDNFLDKHRPSAQEQLANEFNAKYETNRPNPEGPENPGGSGAPVKR